MFLMVSEKMDAMEEAKAIIARGGKPSLVIEKLPEDCRGECRPPVMQALKSINYSNMKVSGPKAPPLSDCRHQARGFLGSEMLPLTVLV